MKHLTLTSLTVFLLASCSLIPDYERPAVETPATWSAEKYSKPVQIAYDWWRSFKSEELNSLMQGTLINNTDIRAGLQTIEQSRAALKIAGADLLPSASGSGGASKTRTNPASGKTTTSTSLSAGLDISYELDLFGANRADVEAARASLQSSLYEQDSLALVVMGEVATGYFTLLDLYERLAIADSNLANAREVLRIIEARVREGMESDIELTQQTSAVATSEASRSSLVEQIANAENALAVLLGKAPQTIEITRRQLDALQVPDIAAGQPSDLLERRPDIRAAEANLRAANADIGAARAAFFPSVSLGAGSTISWAGLGDPSATIFSLASSLSAPIFQGGRLQGGLDQATARQLELVETYRGTVLTSFQEVEDALAAVKSARDREISLKTAMEQAQRAYSLTKNRYDAGQIDFETLLDTQNAQLSAEDSYAQAKLARLTAAVDLYKALGGSWNS